MGKAWLRLSQGERERETRGKPAEITDRKRDRDSKANYSSHEYSEA